MYVDVDEAAVQAAYEKIHELAVAESTSQAFDVEGSHRSVRAMAP